MRAQLTRRTLLGLVLELLFPSMVLAGNCSVDYPGLLKQLRKQAEYMQDTSRLLDPFMRSQGLDMQGLREHCTESPAAFPSEGVLRGLDRQGFLRSLNASLGRVLHTLAAFQLQLPAAPDLKQPPRPQRHTQDLETQRVALLYLHGLRNNIHCMSQLLGSSSDAAEPPRADLAASPPPTLAPDGFSLKVRACRTLRGFHGFMHSVRRVLGQWNESLSRRRRHSPHRAPRKGAPRTRPSGRGRRLVPRRQRPR
ncbi:oncostatin-M [Carlito syrichta]|uniref:Oncostatin-M n=1 Tax=Carlito syrichta TaxID=1868482 RepID=A0A1U7TMY4_CARSF|nr:oncostatin-M [Carlito syrichta]